MCMHQNEYQIMKRAVCVCVWVTEVCDSAAHRTHVPHLELTLFICLGELSYNLSLNLAT